MDEARAVLARLERIDALEQGGAPPRALLDELRELVHEAEAWAQRERDSEADAAVTRLGEAVGANPGYAGLSRASETDRVAVAPVYRERSTHPSQRKSRYAR
jgi:hypothetical protein